MSKYGIISSLLVFACVAGCGDGAQRKDTYKVSGVVKYNGAPLPGATVSFSPVAQGTPPALGMTDAEGKYVLTTYANGDGACQGEFKVMVSKSAPGASSTGGAPAHDPTGQNRASGAPVHSGPAGKASSGGGSLIPEKYSKAATTPLTKTVNAGDNVIDIDVQ